MEFLFFAIFIFVIMYLWYKLPYYMNSNFSNDSESKNGVEEYAEFFIDSPKFQDGVQAFRENNYIKSFKIFKPLAEQGDAEAQHYLGILYGNGDGVSQNDKEADKWWHLSAEQGHAEAQYILGKIYKNEAEKWWHLSAEQGHKQAQFQLGLLYFVGDSVKQDYSEALKWWHLSAEQGQAEAQLQLGFLYERGLGVLQDYTEALKWFRLSAEQGQVIAQFNLGVLYHKAIGVPQDYNEAAKWWRLAADQRHAASQGMLGFLYFLGLGVPQNNIQAYMWVSMSKSNLWEEADESLKKLENRLTIKEIVKGKAKALRCVVSGYKYCD